MVLSKLAQFGRVDRFDQNRVTCGTSVITVTVVTTVTSYSVATCTDYLWDLVKRLLTKSLDVRVADTARS